MSTSVLIGVALQLAVTVLSPSARADDQSFLDKLGQAGIDQYLTPDYALQIGRWYCQQLRNGRTTQAAYSDFIDANAQERWLPPNGPVGTVLGAAIFQLCPEQGAHWNGRNDLDYLPQSQR